jgi:hypothetical protein
MEIGEIISDALKYPSSDWTKVIILGVIFIASIVIVPIFLGIGYLFRIIKATLAGSDELPDFDEIGDMFVDGLKIFVVGIVYAIPLIIIAAIISLIFGYSQATAIDTGTITGFGLFAFIAGYIIYIIVAIIIGLIESIAIANMALYDGELGAAFRFSEVMKRISMIGWGKYIVWYIIMVLLGFVAGLIAGLTFIILIGFILAPLIIFPYVSMFGARSLALLFASSEDARVEE